MRSLVLAALLLFSSESYANDDPNYVYSVGFSSGFAVSRYAKPEYTEQVRTGRPKCVFVEWVYSPKDVNNLDDLKAERERAIEAVAAELSNQNARIAAGTTVGGTSANWLLYTATDDALAKALNERFKELSQSKYRVRTAADSDWSMYEKYVQALRATK